MRGKYFFFCSINTANRCVAGSCEAKMPITDLIKNYLDKGILVDVTDSQKGKFGGRAFAENAENVKLV